MPLKQDSLCKNKIKWNISILVIFVLLASSLMWVLTMHFVKQMMSYTSQINDYYKSYYISKAGLELALTEIDNAGIGFFRDSNDQDDIFEQNFDCSNCDLDLSIQWRSNHVSDSFWLSTGCDDNNAFVLNRWESFVLPLFVQNVPDSHFEFFQQPEPDYKSIAKYMDKINFVSNNDFPNDLSVGLVIFSGDTVDRDYVLIKTLDSKKDLFSRYYDHFVDYYDEGIFENSDNLIYFVISNVDDDSVSFCIDIPDITEWGLDKKINIATNKFFVQSIGTYHNGVVGLQAIYGQPIPSFLANTSMVR